MALRGPGVSAPGAIPRSRARGLLADCWTTTESATTSANPTRAEYSMERGVYACRPQETRRSGDAGGISLFDFVVGRVFRPGDVAGLKGPPYNRNISCNS